MQNPATATLVLPANFMTWFLNKKCISKNISNQYIAIVFDTDFINHCLFDVLDKELFDSIISGF